jgi:nucleoside-diphosphate-sugar epimerase
MPDVYVVGGRGYIGSRLSESLRQSGYTVEVIDPGYLVSDTPDESQDVTARGFEVPGDGKPVVWCACIHRLPPGVQDTTGEWDEYADLLMHGCPAEWVEAGHPLVYLSSMQVVTQRALDLYAEVKLDFERWALGRAGVRVIRPGTVWGGLVSPGDPTNRVHTVVNRYLTTGELPDEKWRAYTTRITSLIQEIVDAVDRTQRGELPGDVLTVTDFHRPTVRKDLEDSTAVTDVHILTEARWNAWSSGFRGYWEVPKHPMARLAKARDLPWKENA